jgi:orotate phosphoribosyltransferase
LCDYDTLIDVALEANYITEADVETLKQWRENPEAWGK